MLGGKIPKMAAGVGVHLQDGRTGVVLRCLLDQKMQDQKKVWVACSDTSYCECDTERLSFKSPYSGRLGPESLNVSDCM